MGYDRWGRFPLDFEPDGIPFGSKLKGKHSPRSYRIEFEIKKKCSFLSMRGLRVTLLCAETSASRTTEIAFFPIPGPRLKMNEGAKGRDGTFIISYCLRGVSCPNWGPPWSPSVPYTSPDVWGDSGGGIKFCPMIPRGASLSDGCTFDLCRNSRLPYTLNTFTQKDFWFLLN